MRTNPVVGVRRQRALPFRPFWQRTAFAHQLF